MHGIWKRRWMPLRHLGLLFSSYMDWGASLGFDWAARHPNRVKSFLLYGSHGPPAQVE
jgi:hypothetical protein